MKQKRISLMTILLLGLISVASVGAEEISWEFYYVSEKVEPAAPVIWITQTENGGVEDGISEDDLKRDSEKVLYLHTESYGEEGIEMTLTPLADVDDSNSVIPYSFSYSGSDNTSGSQDVAGENKTITLVWADPDPIRIRRDYTLKWFPDQTAVAAVSTGTYKTTFTVEVRTT